MKIFFRKFTLLLCLILLLIPSRDAYARPDPDSITIDAVYGFNGYFRMHALSPITVNVGNSGELFNGWVLANLETWVPETHYTYPVVLPPGGTREIEFASYGCFDYIDCRIPIEVYSSDGNLLKSIIPPSYPLSTFDTLLLHVGQPVQGMHDIFNRLNPGFIYMTNNGLISGGSLVQYQPRIFPTIIEPSELPTNPLLLEGVSTIVIGLDDYLSLEQSQEDILGEFVQFGGSLIIYFRGTHDPVDGWETDTLLPVSPAGNARMISSESLFNSALEYIPEDSTNMVLMPNTRMQDRGMQGEVFLGGLLPGVDDETGEAIAPWKPPDFYTVLAVVPESGSEAYFEKENDMPLITLRQIGLGKTSFVSFDPFTANPGAHDIPILLLASRGLLNPICPPADILDESVQVLSGLQDVSVASFFSRGSAGSGRGIINWMGSIGMPALIYLLGLPILMVIARGRGQVILLLFIFWSVGLTAATIFFQKVPASNEAIINDANLYWINAGSGGTPGSGRLFNFFTYTSRASIPHSLTFEYENTIVDEVVDPNIWPYDSVTIEQGMKSRLPDIPIETFSFNSITMGRRQFMYRRPTPEIGMNGELEILEGVARLRLEYSLPFETISGRLYYNGQDFWIGGLQDNENGLLEMDIKFSELAGNSPDEAQQHLWGPLYRFWNLAEGTIIPQSIRYLHSSLSGEPTHAILMLASDELNDDITLDSGGLERDSLSILIITIPVKISSSNPPVAGK